MIARYCLKYGWKAEIINISLKSVILVDPKKILPSYQYIWMKTVALQLLLWNDFELSGNLIYLKIV